MDEDITFRRDADASGLRLWTVLRGDKGIARIVSSHDTPDFIEVVWFGFPVPFKAASFSTMAEAEEHARKFARRLPK